MIGSLKGRIEYRGNDHICVDVAGVGYIVYCSEKTLSSLPVDGEFITLFTDLVVREDLLQLFGFLIYRLLLMFQEFVQKLFFKFNFEIHIAAIDNFNGFTHFMLYHCLYNNFEF